MADISKIKVPNGTTYDLKDATARSRIDALDGSIPERLTDLTNDTSPSNPISSNLSIANSLYSGIAVFSGGKTSASDGVMGAELGKYGVLYLQGDSSYSPSIRFYGKTGSTTRTSYITEATDGELTIFAPAGQANTYLHYWPETAANFQVPFINTNDQTTGQFVGYKNNGLRYRTRAGTASADGLASLYLGNNTASGTAGNATGSLVIYGTSERYVQLMTASTMTVSPTIRFPDKAGTIALLSDISGGGGGGGKTSLWTGAITSGSATLSDSVANYDMILVVASNGQTGTSFVSTMCDQAGTFNVGWEASAAYIEFTLSGSTITINNASTGRYLRRVVGYKLSGDANYTNADSTSY